jgi:hypothetical protein
MQFFSTFFLTIWKIVGNLENNLSKLPTRHRIYTLLLKKKHIMVRLIHYLFHFESKETEFKSSQ